jgi:type III secretion inner rod protein HrpB2
MDPRIASLFQDPAAIPDETAVSRGAVPDQLVDKFQALLAQGTMHVPEPGGPGQESIIGQAVTEQAAEYRSVPNDLIYSMQHMSSLSMQRLMAVDMTLQLEVASLDADLQVKMATVQASKESLQTLMKNQ